jgi:hypothetical protein
MGEPPPCKPTACEGMTYQCGDCDDNDGDGKLDALDPECTGPCDDLEDSFQTGLPGDNVDCFQDCFFDGNSGEGDDGCSWNLKCDPENPGEGGLCEYMPTPMCMLDDLHNTPEQCIELCSELTPNGCDCFGCCTVTVDGEEVHVFLGGDPECSTDNLDACTSCTPSEDCNNPCEPEKCEICVGDEELPDGCEEATCEDGVEPCVDGVCPDNFYCSTGCCTPVPG